MAEIISGDSRGRGHGNRRKKLSTRVDLTPMVDLGFLLITFFVFTTSLSEAKAMSLVLPDDSPTDNSSLAPASKTLSLILAGDDVVYYYHGQSIEHVQQTGYAAAGIRAVLQHKIEEVNRTSARPGQTIVLIKPTMESSYRNVVAVLDEMRINGISRYVLMDPSPQEVSAAARP